MDFKFKVGEKVKLNNLCLEYDFLYDTSNRPGEVATIVNVKEKIGLTCNGRLLVEKGYELSNQTVVFERWLEHEFTLNDLKDGQLVELEDGSTFIKFGQMIVEVTNSKFLSLDRFDKKLEFKDDKKLSVKAVYNSNNAVYVSSVHGRGSLAATLLDRSILRKDLEKVYEKEESYDEI